MQNNVHGILSSILKEHAFTRTNGRVASDRTTTAYGEVLRMCFDRLHDLNYMISNPRNLSEAHVKALCAYWYENKKSTGTIQEYLSKLRVFSGWIGKKGMVKSLDVYLPDVPKNELKVSRIARVSKSWAENGVDVREKIEIADGLDPRFGLMLRMMLAFGLRRCEVLQCTPHKWDRGDKLAIPPGIAKGGRPRDVHIETVEQREVLEIVQSSTKKAEKLGWDTKRNGEQSSLESSIRRYNRMLAKIGITKLKDGVTGHGLRAQYAENAALFANLIPPTLGGTAGQMTRDERQLKSSRVSQLLGHNREHIVAAYFGAFGRDATQDDADRCKIKITAAVSKMSQMLLAPVPAERLSACVELVAELGILDIDITVKQAHHLWHLHSLREGHAWVQPRKGNAEAMEVQAMKVCQGK